MITSRAFLLLDFQPGRALDLREASAMMKAGVPGGKNGVLTHDASATRALKVCELVACCG